MKSQEIPLLHFRRWVLRQGEGTEKYTKRSWRSQGEVRQFRPVSTLLEVKERAGEGKKTEQQAGWHSEAAAVLVVFLIF